jgi:hypothetical protein
MPIPIPPDFDYKKEMIDPNEIIVRDVLGLNVENWAKFRYTIGVGTKTEHLQGPSISDNIKDAYRELGKCHYEVVCSLGYCKFALLSISFGNDFISSMSLRDFYFHGGALLDNLSRLVHITNVPNAASATEGRNGDLVRRVIDRGKLVNPNRQDIAPHVGRYTPHLNSNLIVEFSAVRNAFAHYWRIPIDNGQWPRDQLRDKAFAWPYDDPGYKNYSGWTPVGHILDEHMKELEYVQNAVFGLLLNGITTFETNNSVSIVSVPPKLDRDKSMYNLFGRLREELPLGIKPQLTDQGGFLAVRLQSDKNSDPKYPRFRITIWCGTSALRISRRQLGFMATEGAVQRRVPYTSPDINGDVTKALQELINQEQDRPMKFRQSPPGQS